MIRHSPEGEAPLPASVFDFGGILTRLDELGERATFLRPVCGGRILVVDDVEANVALLSAILESEVYFVVPAFSGRQALAKTESEKPDLILLDIMISPMDGFEVCRRIKAEPATAQIPIILVTGLADEQTRARGFEAGANDYLTLPVNYPALMACIRKLLS